jgi:hypothetical protein
MYLRNYIRIAMAKATFNKKMALFLSKMNLELRKKLVKCYVWSIAVYGDETWSLPSVFCASCVLHPQPISPLLT